MNIRQFTIALLVSAIPLFAHAKDAGVSLNAGDFLSAKKISREGDTIVRLKLSKSGKAKLKKISEKDSAQHAVHTEIGGVRSDLTLREPIEGDGVDLGPYSQSEASQIVSAINN